jgi:hypothetical protein
MRIFLVASLLLLSFTTPALPEQEKSRSLNKIPTVSLCELVRNPQKYDKEVVRLEGVYSVGWEWVLLYDLNCRGKNRFILPIVAGDTEEASKRIETTISDNLKYGRRSGDRVGLVMKGLFLAPEPNPKIREVGNDWPTFKIMEIEKVFEVPEDAPPPVND